MLEFHKGYTGRILGEYSSFYSIAMASHLEMNYILNSPYPP